MKDYDLQTIRNPDCKRRCNKTERREITCDDLCTHCISVTDKLAIRCVGPWAKIKIEKLLKYFELFGKTMKNKWDGINYIEICSGPGRCVNRENGDEFNGTALAIAQHNISQFYNKIFFFDINPEVISSLNLRLSSLNTSNIQTFIGDYTETESICTVLDTKISKNHLNLVFIDPTDCSVPLTIISAIKATLKRFDLIINVATKTDFNRNVKNAVLDKEHYSTVRQKYISFLGSEDFFNDDSVKDLAHRNEHEAIRRIFRDYYIRSLKSLGFAHFDYSPVKGYYDLLFASAHPLGYNFWIKTNRISAEGQRNFDFT